MWRLLGCASPVKCAGAQIGEVRRQACRFVTGFEQGPRNAKYYLQRNVPWLLIGYEYVIPLAQMGKSPPSPSAGVRRNELSGQGKLVLALSLTIGGVILVLIIGRVFGLICPFHIPTGAMSPAVAAGDHVLMEGVTYLSREPSRGDVL